MLRAGGGRVAALVAEQAAVERHAALQSEYAHVVTHIGSVRKLGAGVWVAR